MRGKRTAVILGAGASHCYQDGIAPVPLQKDIAGLLGGYYVSSGLGAPDSVGPAGLVYSQELAMIMRDRYNLPEDSDPASNRLALWEQLRQRGETLESVYEELDRSLPAESRSVLIDFAAILRTSVKQPVPSRETSSICRYHRRLVEALEPGDYVINFNWDSLMADALLYHCPFWYPRTGFGPWRLSAISDPNPKLFPIQSLVHIFHVHGSVLLFELLENGHDSNGSGKLVYLGPPGYPEGNSLVSLLGVSKETQKPTKSPSDAELHAAGRGFLYCADRWLKPVFVPPSSGKGEYLHWYYRSLRIAIHSLLPATESFIVAGYSFPRADIKHLSSIFVPGVIRSDASLTVVDPSNPDPEFQSQVRSVFTGLERFDFDNTDFRTFSEGLERKDSQILL